MREHSTDVMTRVDNRLFEFTPDADLGAADVAVLRRCRSWLPGKYTKTTIGGRRSP